MVAGLIIRIKHSIAEISADKSESQAVSFAPHVLVGNIVSRVGAAEHGLIDGLTTYYWEDRLWWAKMGYPAFCLLRFFLVLQSTR